MAAGDVGKSKKQTGLQTCLFWLDASKLVCNGEDGVRKDDTLRLLLVARQVLYD